MMKKPQTIDHQVQQDPPEQESSPTEAGSEGAAAPGLFAKLRPVLYGLILVAIAAGVGLTIRASGEPGPRANMDPDASTIPEPNPDQNEAQVDLDDLPPYVPGESGNSAILRRADPHTLIIERPSVEISKYTVQRGDSIFAIAEAFGLQPETILWGNYAVLEDNPHGLRPEQELSILPVDGTYHVWKEGDTLEKVASFYGVTPADIVDWPGNGLPPYSESPDELIEAGTGLVIPGGQRAFVSWQAPRISRANPAVAKVSGPGACGSVYEGPIGEGFFIWPTPGTYLSGNAFSSWHPGIDIAGGVGNAVWASASGVVVYSGWNNYGYGIMIVVDHGDGWQTLYAHLSATNVGCGQSVYMGAVIGALGSTGNSSGAHLHFEIQHDNYGKVNPYDLVSP